MGVHERIGLDKVSNNVKIITRGNGTTSELVHAISQINPHIHLHVHSMFPQFPLPSQIRVVEAQFGDNRVTIAMRGRLEQTSRQWESNNTMIDCPSERGTI